MPSSQFSNIFFPQSKKNRFLNRVTQDFNLFLRVQRKLGVVARVALIFSRRGYDIHSFQYMPTQLENQANMHLSFKGNQEQLRGVVNEIRKLSDVLQIDLLR